MLRPSISVSGCLTDTALHTTGEDEEEAEKDTDFGFCLSFLLCVSSHSWVAVGDAVGPTKRRDSGFRDLWNGEVNGFIIRDEEDAIFWVREGENKKSRLFA